MTLRRPRAVMIGRNMITAASDACRNDGVATLQQTTAKIHACGIGHGVMAVPPPLIGTPSLL